MDAFALELGPRIDDLVQVAREGGEAGATRSTIHYWVSRGYVLAPRQQARRWRYPNVAVGQVDTIARLRLRGVHRDFFEFAQYVEAGTGEPETARRFTLTFLTLWKERLAAERERLAMDPEALRREAAAAARMRGRRAPLPHRVRTTLDERTQAMLYTLSSLIGASLSSQDEEDGLLQLERLVGLRSGRGGASRDVSELSVASSEWPTDPNRLLSALEAASPERLEFARRGVELGVVWFPPLRSLFGGALGPAASVTLVDVIAEWERMMTPDVYVLLFSAFVANGLERASDSDIHVAMKTFLPEVIGTALLSELSPADQKVAERRLRRYQRLRLEHLRAIAAVERARRRASS